MRILLLCPYFPPEIGTGPHMPFELGESLVKLGHAVAVVTGFPRYHVPVTPQEYRGRLWCREQMAGIDVFRIRFPDVGGKVKIIRGTAHLLAPAILALRALPLAQPDVVSAATPPLALGLAARLVARRFHVPCVVNVQDLFPQSAVDLGVLRNRVAIRFFEAMERFIYRSSDAITVMSDGNRDYVIGKGSKPERVITVPNWVDAEEIRPADRHNDFRAFHGLHDDFVVLFAGTMGWSQGLGTVVEAARELAAEPGLVFFMVGDGVEKPRLQKQAAGLTNVRFLPIQPKEVYPQVLAASDAGLVTLRPEVATPTVPSKIGTIMAAGRPILASVPLHGDAPRLVTSAAAGVVVRPGDAHALAAAILQLKHDRAAAEQMGQNGRRYAETHLSRSAIVARIATIFQRAAQGKDLQGGIPVTT